MKLRSKFNLVMVTVFLAGLAISGLVSWRLLQQSAREEVIENAGIMMGAALSIRGYTVEQIRPLLSRTPSDAFLPQTVPAFAATETFNALRTSYPDFSYKEAALNPTNPRDRATDWEADIIQHFRDDAAPAKLVARYGDANGFGWQMHEAIGSQIVSVPMSLPLAKAQRAFGVLMLSLFAVFVALFAALNLLLGRMVIRPITEISRVADAVSMGDLSVPEFHEGSQDEIGTLRASFNRMRRSLERAMEMLQG
jgi:protein-histidine pros-kinase